MNKYIFSGLVFVTVCYLASAQKKGKVQHGACDGLSEGDACTVGNDVSGVCEELRECAGEPECPLFCRVAGKGKNQDPGKREKGKSAKKSKNPNSCEQKNEGDACGQNDAKVCTKVDPECDESVEDCRLVCVPPQDAYPPA